MPRIDSAPDDASFGIITTGVDGTIESWNDGAQRLFGYTESEVIGSPISRLECRDTPRSIARALLEERAKIYLHKDGHPVDAMIEQSPIPNAAGEVVGHRVIARAGIAALRSATARFAEAEAIAHLGSFDLDLLRDHTVWSDELCRIFGFDPKTFDPNREDVMERVLVEDREVVREAIRKCVHEAVPIALDYRVIRTDGETRLFSFGARLVQDADGRAVRLVGTVQDITERHLQMATVRAVIAHEINSPLAAIVNSLDFALREVGTLDGSSQLEEIVDALGDARVAARRIRGIVRDLQLLRAKLTGPVPVTDSRRRLRVCVIDDDEQLLRSLARLLAREHDTVAAISRPQDALERFRAGERFDAIVCDLMMPEMTGMEFQAELERIDRGQAARTIFMTGGTITEAATWFLSSMVSRRLEKPFAIRDLLTLIDEVAVSGL